MIGDTSSLMLNGLYNQDSDGIIFADELYVDNVPINQLIREQISATNQQIIGFTNPGIFSEITASSTLGSIHPLSYNTVSGQIKFDPNEFLTVTSHALMNPIHYTSGYAVTSGQFLTMNYITGSATINGQCETIINAITVSANIGTLTPFIREQIDVYQTGGNIVS